MSAYLTKSEEWQVCGISRLSCRVVSKTFKFVMQITFFIKPVISGNHTDNPNPDLKLQMLQNILIQLTVWARTPPHPRSSCRHVPMCPGWCPSQHQTAAPLAPAAPPHTPPSVLPAAVEVAVETPCETSSCGAAAWRLPAAPGEDRETGRGGGRWRAETPRRSWEESWEEKRSRGDQEEEKRGRREEPGSALSQERKEGERSSSSDSQLPLTAPNFFFLTYSADPLLPHLLLLSPSVPGGRWLSVMLMLLSRHFSSPSDPLAEGDERLSVGRTWWNESRVEKKTQRDRGVEKTAHEKGEERGSVRVSHIPPPTNNNTPELTEQYSAHLFVVETREATRTVEAEAGVRCILWGLWFLHAGWWNISVPFGTWPPAALQMCTHEPVCQI